ncbi:MAG: hypothetical protein IKG81_10395 [Bacteroidales bacterium]|nr:hypothetical protein [Bacteroidales bacterium]
MRRIVSLLSLALVATIFASCNNHQEELDAAIKKTDSLTLIINNKDAELDSLFSTLNQIEENLAAVNSRYNAVQELRRANIEGQPNVKNQINEQIKSIENLMAANKQKLANLQAKINSEGKESTRLQELVNRQEERIAAQESQIAELLTELENNKVLIKKLNQDVSDLTASNEEKDQFIQRQTNEANRAYYVVGSYADLSEAGIVYKSGGFIGIGRHQGTRSEMPLDRFTQIDRTKVTTIPVNMKNAVVISNHPDNSYEMVMDESDSRKVSYLRILNPAKFWEQTRFLVISTK